MKTLIDKVLSLESEAERILEDARKEAKKADQEAHARIARLQAEAAAALEQRISEYRSTAEKKHREEVAAAQVSIAQEIDKVKKVPDSALAGQAARIVDRFSEL